MPATSQAQRGFLAEKFGPAWMQQHHFDNKGPLPQYVQRGSPNIGLHLYQRHITIMPKPKDEPAQEGQHPKITYPADHMVGMRVPHGGSACSKCSYLGSDGQSCDNDLFQRWNFGDSKLPNEASSYCCDFFDPVKGSI